MNSFEKILLRLKEQLGIATDKGVAELLEIVPSAFNDRKKRNTFPIDKLLVFMSNNPNIDLDLDYVLTGKRKTALEELGEQGYLPGQAIQSAPSYSSVQTKEKTQSTITKDELELIERYRNAPFEIKAQIMQLLLGVEIKSSPQSSQTFHGDVSDSELAARDIVNYGRTRKK